MATVLSSAKYTPDGVPYYGLNDFKDLQWLDSGGCGIVYKGYDVTRFTRRRRTVAVKMFALLDVYAEREIEILKTHSHPHIVEFFGVIWDGEVINRGNSIKNPIYTGYVMEYMELGSLYKEIRDVSKHYDMKLIMLWIQQIGSGLQYLHEHEILHRDVTPKNILLATRTHLKLAGFARARNISHQNTYTTGQIATESYMAPEVLTSNDYGVPADVYSFGVTIWEIICRKHPWEHITFENGCIELPIDPDKMSEDSWNFVKRCWQRNISDRPSIKEIIAFKPTFDLTIVIEKEGPIDETVVVNRSTSTWDTITVYLRRVLLSEKYTPNGVPYHRFNDFQELKRVDGGGYGIVFKGYDVTRFTRRRRMVAVKTFIHLDVYAEREIEILKTHSHPHIVELFGVIWDGEMKDIGGTKKMPLCFGYVMEYLELGSLYKEIHDVSKHYDIKLIVLWIEQIGSGLQYLHEHEILHRDVNPKNILLATRTHLKLADFGLARNISHQNTYTTGRIGTDSYMAPEIVGTEKNYGPPADVFSFGITIWEIICRKHPWENAKFENDGIELPIDIEQMSEDSWNFVKRCWQRNISDRPSVEEISAFAATFEQTILVMGGDWNNNNMTLWNRGESTWTVSRMELPDLILPVGVVYLDDELYLITRGKAFFKLDKNMKWKRLADKNEERSIISNSCLKWNGYIWVFGGWYWEKGCLKSVERYDPKEDKWTRMPDMKYGRSDPAAAVCNGKIYICGGWGDDYARLKSVECFDPESGVWTDLTDMPTPRLNHSLVCYRNKLVVIGGWNGEERTTTVLELDPHEKNGQWKELSPLLYTSFVSVAAVLGREIFAISRNSDEVQIFNGINWRVGPSSPPNYCLTPSAVLVPQEFAERLSSYPNDLQQ